MNTDPTILELQIEEINNRFYLAVIGTNPQLYANIHYGSLKRAQTVLPDWELLLDLDLESNDFVTLNKTKPAI